jgi:hypothetical protein
MPSKNIKLVFMLLVVIHLQAIAQNKLSLNRWHYIEADSSRAMWGNYEKPEWLRYYGLDAADINGDGFRDIVAGRYFYLNPAGNMQGAWKRYDLGLNADACMIVDIDDDGYMDVLAMAYPNVLWLEAANHTGDAWSVTIIGQVPRTDHVNGQGFRHTRLTKNPKGELLFSAETGLFAASIPAQPAIISNWKFIRIAPSSSDEGIGLGDIDGDGDTDIVLGDALKKGDTPNILNWFENPGTIDTAWKKTSIGKTENAIDRIEVADFNADGKPDIAISEELYPGLEPLAHLYTFKNPGNNTAVWQRSIHFKGYSNNNLDAADLDKDGDIDLVTSEHKGKEYPTLIFENDGKGQFTRHLLDKGKESHLGNKLVDLDGDGDLDMISTAWDHHRFLHIWRNDAIVKKDLTAHPFINPDTVPLANTQKHPSFAPGADPTMQLVSKKPYYIPASK